MPRQPAYPDLAPAPDGDRVHIYSLTCPVGGMVRYIGQTYGSLSARLSGHIAQMTAKKQVNPELIYWKQELQSVGLQPTMALITTVPRYDADCVERKWTRHYQRLGNPMLNVRNLLLAESAMGYDLWELNDIIDKHNLSPNCVTIGADVCRQAGPRFLSGKGCGSQLLADKIATFLKSLPAERVKPDVYCGITDLVEYFLNPQTKAIWQRA